MAEVIPGNRPMLRVFEEAGFAVGRTFEGGTVEVTFPIEPTEEYMSHVDERDHLAVVASLKGFFAPRSLVVIGASPRSESIGGRLFRNVLAAEYSGTAYPVNRGGVPVAGVHAYAGVDELPERPDLAIVCVPAAHVLESVEALSGMGSLQSASFPQGSPRPGPRVANGSSSWLRSSGHTARA